MIPAKRSVVRARAISLLAKHKVSRAPVPVEKIARGEGVQVFYTPLQGDLSGMALIRNDVPMIVVNSLHHPNRQRFTLAHELAHHVLHPTQLASKVHVDRAILRRDQLSSTGKDASEVEANTFAAEMLMPETLLSQHIEDGFDVDNEVEISKLARRFRVSTAALQFRLIALLQ